MSNPYFSAYSALPRNTNARAEAVNAIIDGIVVGFDNVPSALSIANAAAIAAGILATLAQWAAATGLVNVIAGAYPTAVASLTDGLILGFRANLTNTSTTPTFQADATTARTITRQGGAALLAGDIKINGEYLIRYNLANTRWELMNPTLTPLANIPTVGSGTGAQTSTNGGPMILAASSSGNINVPAGTAGIVFVNEIGPIGSSSWQVPYDNNGGFVGVGTIAKPVSSGSTDIASIVGNAGGGFITVTTGATVGNTTIDYTIMSTPR